MSDYDDFEKLFCGPKWVPDKDENMEKLLDHAGASEMERKMSLEAKPSFRFTRDGDAIKCNLVMGADFVHDYQFKFGEEFEFKDKEENPTMFSKLTCTFKDGMMTEITVSQLPNSTKPMVNEFTLVGDQLVTTTYVQGDPSVKAVRYHNRT